MRTDDGDDVRRVAWDFGDKTSRALLRNAKVEPLNLGPSATHTLGYPEFIPLLYGEAATPILPEFSSEFSGFTVTPALPGELVLDPETGEISGIAPDENNFQDWYTVTAHGVSQEISIYTTVSLAEIDIDLDPNYRIVVDGFAANRFNSRAITFSVGIEGEGAFYEYYHPEYAPVTLNVNDEAVSSNLFSFTIKEISAPVSLDDGPNTIQFEYSDAVGRRLYANEIIWSGSNDFTINLRDAAGGFYTSESAEVTILAADNRDITATGTAELGQAHFSNIPDRTLMIQVVTESGLRGFGAAHGEAQARASGARSEWVGITGAQRYGARIADNWKAEPPETYDPEELTNKEAQIAALQGRRDDLQQEKGALSSELFAAENRKELTCPGCEAKLQVKSRRDDSGALIEELVAADSCDVDTDDLAKRIGVIAAEISGTSTSIATLTADAHELRAAGVLAEQADAITDNAAAKHKLVGKWEACAATLSPDGIPAEILSDSLKPFNNRLRSTSVATDGWPQVTVTAQMDVLVDGRPYALQSESSKWRADVALADAVAHLSGVRLLVIDRMDVLDLAGRSQFIGWMQAVQNDYDSVLIFGTLKTAPSLPAGMQYYWIEKGELES